MTKDKAEPGLLIFCCIVSAAGIAFLADYVWMILLEFFYGAFLVDPTLSEIGAEEMGIATADTLLVPALLILWIASSYILYRIVKR